MTTMQDIWDSNDINASQRHCRIGMVYRKFTVLPNFETNKFEWYPIKDATTLYRPGKITVKKHREELISQSEPQKD